jgi:hypothetical protein
VIKEGYSEQLKKHDPERLKENSQNYKTTPCWKMKSIKKEKKIERNI